MEKEGLTLVFTGNGKGKTTSAMGQVLRAVGHGCGALVVFFMKGRDYGEYKAAEQLAGLDVVKAGRDCFVDRENPDPVDLSMAREGFALAREAALKGNYDLVVLDEINVAVDFGLVPLQDVLSLIREKHPRVHLILTGRYAHPEIIEAADTVSELKEIKHHYNSGIGAKKGIEY